MYTIAFFTVYTWRKYVNAIEVPARNTRAANVRRYRTEVYTNSKYKNTPYCKASKLWDTLPREIETSQTLHELKSQVKAHYPSFIEDFYLT